MTVRSIAVLDRTKEPGAEASRFISIALTLFTNKAVAMCRVLGGRYGLSSKEFTPAMIKAVFENLAQPRRKIILRLGSTMTFAIPVSKLIPAFRSNRTTWCAPSFLDLARTERSALTKSRSKSSAKTPTILRKDISFTIQRIRRDDDFASALRSTADQVHLFD